MNNLENKTSYGCDGISNKLLKLIKNEISKPITLIVNQCLTTGIFPTAFKIAKVKPICSRDKATQCGLVVNVCSNQIMIR